MLARDIAEGKYQMQKLISSIIFTLLVLPSVQQQIALTKPKHSAVTEVPTIAYCDLIRNPELYDQKTVRVRAIYRYGSEWSELYCLECLNAGQTWVDFDNSFKSRTPSSVVRKLGDNGFKGRTVSIVAVGKFYGSSGGYGHMNGYRFKFEVNSVENAEIILSDSPVPSALPKKALRRMHC